MDSGVVAIIPARSGSRTVKDKNIKHLVDKPLMGWAIEAALKSKLLDRVIVSTDSDEYADIAREWGAEAPFLRPAALAEDVPTEDVLIHAVNEVEKTQPKLATVVCIQCTTPLVQPQDIDLTISSVGQFADSAITVTEVSEHPEWAFLLSPRKRLKPYISRVETKGAWGVRQNLQKLYRPNGAVYAVKRDYLFDKRRIIAKRCVGVVMPRLRSFDVDSLDDFLILEAYIEKVQRFNKPEYGPVAPPAWSLPR